MTTTGNSIRYRELLFLLGCGIVSFHFTLSLYTKTYIYVDINAFIEGTERLPFQYRALTAWLAAAVEDWRVFAIVAGKLDSPINEPRAVALMIFSLISAFGAGLVTKHAVQKVTNSWAVAVAAAVGLYYCYYFNLILPYRGAEGYFSYPYDVPQSLFFALAFLFIITNNRLALGATIIVTALNRETAMFIPMLYFLYYWSQRPLIPLIRDSILLFIPCMVVKVSLYQYYAGNGLEETENTVMEGLFVNQVTKNIESLIKPWLWPNILSVYGFLWLALIAVWQWIPDKNLKRCFLICIPWALSVLLVGRVQEIRLWNELNILILVALSLAFCEWLRQFTATKQLHEPIC